MKLAVVGVGIVGGAVADGLERLGHEIFRHDIRLSTTIDQTIEFQPEVVFVCVPTPSREDGACDVSIVESVVRELLAKGFNGVVAIKSTVTPGTTQRLLEESRFVPGRGHHGHCNICFVPEFLRERSAFYDFTEGHGTLIIGAPCNNNRDWIIAKITEAHGRYPTAVLAVNPTEAELVKYFNNVYNAARVTFANGFYDVCKTLGANYTKVKDTFISRGVATDMYLDVNEKLRGFSGPCLPKETAAFAHLCDSLGVDAKIFRTIVEDNKLYKKTVWPGMRE